MSETVEQANARYKRALHAVQSGVAALMHYDRDHASPKDLRIGMNSAMISNSALTQLLIEKGVITESEYFTSLADFAEFERETYEDELTRHIGTKVNLR